ncbi:MAG: flagellar filament capping protein FliD [Candidatus Latescibacteria bacterium]|nr:flagellar filament capping protein FliD [Candidatus Latescibacterota bacterium]
MLNASNFNSTVNSLLSRDNAQLSRVRGNRSSLNSTRGTFTRLDSLTSALETQAATLALPATSSSNIFKQTGLTSSDSTTVAATSSTTTATPGTHNLQVYQLGQPFTVMSEDFTASSTDLNQFLARGTYEFSIGGTPITFTIGTSGDGVIQGGPTGNGVLIAEGGTMPTDATVLGEISTVINNAGIPGITASVVGNALRITNASGADVAVADVKHDLMGKLGLSGVTVTDGTSSDSTAYSGSTFIPTLAAGSYPFVIELNDSNTTSSTTDTIAVQGSVTLTVNDDTNTEVLTAIANAFNSAVTASTAINAAGTAGSVSSTDRITATVVNESSTTVRLSLISSTTGPTYQIQSITDGTAGGAGPGITQTTVSTAAGSANTQRLFQTTTLSTAGAHTNTQASQYLAGVTTGTIGNTPVDSAGYAADEKGILLIPLDKKQSTGSSGYTKRGTELNSIFSVDGTMFFRDKNEISDAITGVTFELKDTNLSSTELSTFSGDLTPTSTTSNLDPRPEAITSTAVQLVVGSNASNIQTSVQKFIDAYNNVVVFLDAQTMIDATDPTSVVRSTLSGNSTYLNLKRRLSQIVFSQLTPLKTYTDASQLSGGLTSDPTRLQDIGISLGTDGRLSISNTSTFSTKLQSNPNGIIHLFSFDGKQSSGAAASPASPKGIALQFQELMDGYSKTGGVIDQSKKGLDLRIKNLDNQISFLTRIINRKQVQIADQLIRLQEALISSNAQSSFLQSLLLFGFFQASSNLTGR